MSKQFTNLIENWKKYFHINYRFNCLIYTISNIKYNEYYLIKTNQWNQKVIDAAKEDVKYFLNNMEKILWKDYLTFKQEENINEWDIYNDIFINNNIISYKNKTLYQKYKNINT